ncbi:MAG: hypothetical protein BWY99_00958 [Synergistetes bacterium ADurb.BinA166]|nr:MAG: hypothetical protein BWY99_00958 [Synergistetes bacterium ADurb.BinA166]
MPALSMNRTACSTPAWYSWFPVTAILPRGGSSALRSAVSCSRSSMLPSTRSPVQTRRSGDAPRTTSRMRSRRCSWTNHPRWTSVRCAILILSTPAGSLSVTTVTLAGRTDRASYQP